MTKRILCAQTVICGGEFSRVIGFSKPRNGAQMQIHGLQAAK